MGTYLFVVDLANKYSNHVEVFLEKYGAVCFLAACIILFEMKHDFLFEYDARTGSSSDKTVMPLAVLLGLYFVVFISRIIARETPEYFRVDRLIEYIGKNSMSIMFFHIPSFSVITFLVHTITGMEWPDTWNNCYLGELLA